MLKFGNLVSAVVGAFITWQSANDTGQDNFSHSHSPSLKRQQKIIYLFLWADSAIFTNEPVKVILQLFCFCLFYSKTNFKIGKGKLTLLDGKL